MDHDIDFLGTIGTTFADSTPWWPAPRRAAPGAPSVVLVVLDDVGFAQLGCFGSDIATPVLDGVAARGLRYTNFHTTALCSPTRAALLTGRNHHAIGMGRITELAMGFPAYDARIPRTAAMLPQLLLLAGYATFAVGKWHLTPDDECHPAAPRQRWPLARGFERFYGFMEGETHQFVPALVVDNAIARPPRSLEEGYHLTEDLVDQAIAMIRDLRACDPDKPFFLYFCPGACHAPHQAPRPWVERYRGAFDQGWDAWRQATLARQLAGGILPPGTALSPRPDWVPAWDELPDDARLVYARYMEAFAGFLSHTDDQLGRLLGFLERTGDLDNTIVVVLSDNGASSEGGPTGSVNDLRPWNVAPRTVEEALGRLEEIGGPWCHNNYPWGWTVAGNTPFRRWKREVHEGGVADPLIVSWPAGLTGDGGVRRHYVHAIDVAPTLLDLLGVEAPATVDGVPQMPMHGVSFRASLHDADAPEGRRTQYYEMFGCRAIYHDGWKAVTYHPIQDTTVPFDQDRWELYHVAVDPSECHDLAEAHPERLRELVALWQREARRYGVFPLDNRPFSEFTLDRPPAVPARSRYVYLPGVTRVPETVAVNVRNRSHTVRAEVEIPAGGANGVLVAQGSGLGGWSLYLLKGRLCWTHNFVSLEEHHVEAAEPVPPGRHELGLAFERTGEHRGTARLLVDGAVVGTVAVPRFTPMRFSISGAGLTCGEGDGLPVTRRYRGRFPFTGTLHRVVVDVDGEPFADPALEVRTALAVQ